MENGIFEKSGSARGSGAERQTFGQCGMGNRLFWGLR